MEEREAIPAGEQAAGSPAEEALPAEVLPEQMETAPEDELDPAVEQITAEDLFAEPAPQPAPASTEDSELKAVIEAIIYVADDPLSLVQIASALQQPREHVEKLIQELIEEFDKPFHGITIREVAGGFKMTTKPEHHDGVRNFVKSLKPPLKLSLPALETLAVIAYKQPVTGPEIMEIRGVQGAGVLKTLLDRKLIAVAGRKNVIGKPILYKTTKEFLVQFGLKDLSELPSLKEFEEIRRMAMSDSEPVAEASEAIPETAPPETSEASETSETSEAPETSETPETEPEPEPAPTGEESVD